LQKSEKIQYKEIADMLSSVIYTNVYIVSKTGQVLGYALLDNFECDLMREKVLQKSVFPDKYASWLLRIYDATPNLSLENGLCAFSEAEPCLFNEKFTTIVPIFGGGERIGTLIVAKFYDKLSDADLILAEYGAAVVGMEILRDKTGKNEEQARKKAVVQSALNALSYSELEAIIHILSEIEGNDGLLVASRIADRVGITRSVIVNALRKLESAGIVESQSLGMKGTYIKVLNEYLFEEIKNASKRITGLNTLRNYRK
jgi:transcriptional pleiotropic repressor